MNQNTLPSPATLSAPAWPPISSASRRVIARPSPVPPYLREVERSACSKLLNRRASVPGSMPMPVSMTSKRSSTLRASSSIRRTRSVTRPASVNLTALLA